MNKKTPFLALIIVVSAMGFAVFFSGRSLGSKEALPVAGGIVPHHLLAGRMMADFFRYLAVYLPRTIILIVPNHLEQGDFMVSTGLDDWNTSGGLVRTNKEIIKYLVLKKLAGIDQNVLLKESALAGVLPVINRFLPEASVVPIVLSARLAREEAELLAKSLADVAGQGVVVVAAVDFSHYLKKEDADRNDARTWDIIRRFDYHQLFSLGNDYLDSPGSVALLLMTMEKLGRTKPTILAHTNSGEILNDGFTETTSYFSIVYF